MESKPDRDIEDVMSLIAVTILLLLLFAISSVYAV